MIPELQDKKIDPKVYAEKIIKKQIGSSSPKTRKIAKDFLKKYGEV